MKLNRDCITRIANNLPLSSQLKLKMVSKEFGEIVNESLQKRETLDLFGDFLDAESIFPLIHEVNMTNITVLSLEIPNIPLNSLTRFPAYLRQVVASLPKLKKLSLYYYGDYTSELLSSLPSFPETIQVRIITCPATVSNVNDLAFANNDSSDQMLALWSQLEKCLVSHGSQISTLHIYGRDLPMNGGSVLSYVLYRSQVLESLVVEDFALSAAELCILLRALTHYSCVLRRLDLRSSKIPSSACSMLASVVSESQCVRTIGLDKCSFSSEDSLLKLLEACTNPTQVELVSLRDVQIPRITWHQMLCLFATCSIEPKLLPKIVFTESCIPDDLAVHFKTYFFVKLV
ncbi:hypothetical protein PCE1_004458 [Barthelona sp. PCE]